MAFDTPQKVDLSQDLESQWITLSEEQTANYQEYLSGLEEAERAEIIYITKAELEEFKIVLESEHNHHRDRNDIIGGFMQEQVNEWLSSHDIIGEDPKYKETLDSIDAYSYDALFGSDGALAAMGIHDSAKDSISVWLSLSIIEQISKQDTITKESLAGFNEGKLEGFENIFSNMELLKNLAEASETDPEDPDFEKPKLDLTDFWRWNTIFMNPVEGKAFFNRLINSEFNAVTLEEYIEEQNSDQEIQPSFENLESVTKADLEKIVATATKSGLLNEDGTLNDDILEDIEENDSDNWFIKIIKALFSGIIDMWESIGITDGNDEDTQEDIEKTQEAETVNNQKLLSLINSMADSSENTQLHEMLTKNPDKLIRMRKALESISAEESFEETFTDIYGDNHVEGKISNVQKIFDEYWFSVSLPEGTSSFDRSMKLLEEYSRYRNSPQVIWKDTGRMTWAQWAEKRKSENWEISGR